MSDLRRFARRVATLFRLSRAEQELAREIQAHLQLLEDQFVERGMSRHDARAAAKRAFGGVEQAKEHQRDARAFRWLAGWPMDLKLGVRMLARSPGLTVIAVFALAIAIGAGAAYLEFVNDMIRPSLPFPGGERIAGIRVWDAERSGPQAISGRDLAAWRSAATLEDVGAYRPLAGRLTAGGGRVPPARSVEISAAAFRLTPVAPLMGRALQDEDEQPGATRVVVIGQDLWETHFDRDPAVVGRTVKIGPAVHTIVGVMRREFAFPVNHNLWVPLTTAASAAPLPDEKDVRQAFGRLKPGMTAGAARAELTAMLPAGDRQLRADVRPYVDSLLSAEESRATLEAAIYSGNLVFVMLLAICGANIATLVFARTATREAEITVRTALGASRGRICAQLFAEALVLSLLAAVAGLTVAGTLGRWVGRIFTDATGQPLPFWRNEALSLTTILYAIALAVLAAVIVGVIPARKATGNHLQGRLREAGSGGSTLRFGGIWTGVIITQVALTVLFLSAVASVGWTTLRGQSDADVTFSRDQFLTAKLVLEEGTGAPAAQDYQSAYTAIAGRLRSEPGVVNVTYATEMPGTTFGQFRMEFATPEVAAGAVPHSSGLWSRSAGVGPDYFDTVAAPLVAGRVFTAGEIAGNRPVAIVDETFVRLILGGRSALGLMVREQPAQPGGAPGPWYEIIGVVGDVTVNPRKKSFDAMLYRPAALDPTTGAALLIRTRSAASPMAQGLQAAALSARPDARFAEVKTLDRVAEEQALGERIFLRALTVAGAIALLLSTAGIYALVSFTLARRTREIGIRVALGAAPRAVITSTFSRVFLQVGAGVVAAFLPSVALLMRGGGDAGEMTGPGLPATLAVSAFVVAVAMASCAVPLRRALRIEPMQALRSDA